jgi:type IV secretion system protein VirB9
MNRLLVVCLSTTALAGCLTDGSPGTGPETSFVAAQMEAEPPEPQVIPIEIPVAVPGNLKRLPPEQPSAKPVRGEPAIRLANDQSRQQSATYGFLNAIQVFDYMPGALYQVYTAPGYVTTVALAPGEEIITIAAGDTVRWVIGDTTSGEGTAAQSLVLLKPIRPDLKTNIVISTSRGRLYNLEARSLAGDTYNAAITWNYPQEEFDRLKARLASGRERRAETIGSGISIDDLNFGYRLSGDEPRWRPSQVFDDGRRTYIQFPPNLGVTEAPPLFVLGANGDAQLVNYRIKRNYYEVDRLIDVAELRLGESPQTVVRIERIAAAPPPVHDRVPAPDAGFQQVKR